MPFGSCKVIDLQQYFLELLEWDQDFFFLAFFSGFFLAFFGFFDWTRSSILRGFLISREKQSSKSRVDWRRFLYFSDFLFSPSFSRLKAYQLSRDCIRDMAVHRSGQAFPLPLPWLHHQSIRHRVTVAHNTLYCVRPWHAVSSRGSY